MNILTECLSQGTSPVGVVSFAKNYLKEQGFEELYYDRMISPKEKDIAPCFLICVGGSGWEMSAITIQLMESQLLQFLFHTHILN